MDKTISLDSLQRFVVMPLKRLIDKTNQFVNEQLTPMADKEIDEICGGVVEEALTESDVAELIEQLEGGME